MAEKKIDPRLYAPPVEGYSYRDDGRSGGAQGDVTDVEFEYGSGIDADLQPPSRVVVVDQIFRKGPDGRTVADVVLEVEDMPGATEYEVRVAAV